MYRCVMVSGWVVPGESGFKEETFSKRLPSDASDAMRGGNNNAPV